MTAVLLHRDCTLTLDFLSFSSRLRFFSASSRRNLATLSSDDECADGLRLRRLREPSSDGLRRLRAFFDFFDFLRRGERDRSLDRGIPGAYSGCMRGPRLARGIVFI